MTSKLNHTVAALFIAALHLPTLMRADDLIADNLTIQASATIAGPASFGAVNSGLQTGGYTSDAGFHVTVTQGWSEVMIPYTIEAHYEDQWITVDDYGYIDSGGHYESQHIWDVVGYNHFDATYDSEGNELTPAYDEPIYDYVYTGEVWVPESYWGVVGSHSELTQVWVDEQQSNYTDYEYGRPKIQFAATRSDANWAWQVPTGVPGEYRDILLLWDGGLRLPSTDPSRMMALMPDSLTQSISESSEDGTVAITRHTRSDADTFKAVNDIYWTMEGVQTYDKKTGQLKADGITFTQEQNTEGQGMVKQTQIGAQSASFGGVVQVEGDMAVRGVLRVQPGGDLLMGIFTSGQQP